MIIIVLHPGQVFLAPEPNPMMSPRFISRVFVDFRVYRTSKLRESAVYIVYGLVVRTLAWQSYSQRLVKEITQKDEALVLSCTVWMAPVASIPSKMGTSS